MIATLSCLFNSWPTSNIRETMVGIMVWKCGTKKSTQTRRGQWEKRSLGKISNHHFEGYFNLSFSEDNLWWLLFHGDRFGSLLRCLSNLLGVFTSRIEFKSFVSSRIESSSENQILPLLITKWLFEPI